MDYISDHIHVTGDIHITLTESVEKKRESDQPILVLWEEFYPNCNCQSYSFTLRHS